MTAGMRTLDLNWTEGASLVITNGWVRSVNEIDVSTSLAGLSLADVADYVVAVSATWTIGPGGDVETTYADLITLIDHPVKNDVFDIQKNLNEVIDTAAEDCTYNGNGNTVAGNHIFDEAGTIFKNAKFGSQITVSDSGVKINYCELLTGWIKYTAAGSYLQNCVIRGSASLDVDAAMTANNSYIETTDLANGITLTANNCIPGQLEATIEAGGGTVDHTGCLFGVTETAAKFKSASDSRLQPGSPLIDAGTDISLNADIRGRAVPCGNAPDVGIYEAQKRMIPLGGSFLPVFQP